MYSNRRSGENLNIVKRDGKTFVKLGSEYVRVHDENYTGKHTVYFECGECGKLVGHQHWKHHNYQHVYENK